MKELQELECLVVRLGTLIGEKSAKLFARDTVVECCDMEEVLLEMRKKIEEKI